MVNKEDVIGGAGLENTDHATVEDSIEFSLPLCIRLYFLLLFLSSKTIFASDRFLLLCKIKISNYSRCVLRTNVQDSTVKIENIPLLCTGTFAGLSKEAFAVTSPNGMKLAFSIFNGVSMACLPEG